MLVLDIDVLKKNGAISMNIENFKISKESMPSHKIVYMRRVGQYGIENQQLMEYFKTWVKEKHLFDDNAVILGIAWDDVQSVQPERCRYDVCLIVADEFATEDKGISITQLEAGEYAVLEFPHTAEAVQEAWQKGISELMEQGYQLDFSRPVIERYAKQLVDTHRCELCVPIIK